MWYIGIQNFKHDNKNHMPNLTKSRYINKEISFTLTTTLTLISTNLKSLQVHTYILETCDTTKQCF